MSKKMKTSKKKTHYYAKEQDINAFETVTFGPYEWLVLDRNERGRVGGRRSLLVVASLAGPQ